MDVEIVRSRRKTLSLSVDGKGRAIVRAPYGVGREEIARFVERHGKWLMKRLAERSAQLDLSDGAQIELFGRRFTIVAGKACLGEGVLCLPAEGREGALVSLLKRETKARMTLLTERLAAEHGFTFSSVRVSSARGRWGSCNRKGGISYTFRIAFLPERAAEYIAVHELCHTRHFDHSPDFWREVERVLPDYRTLRKAVKERGNVMYYL